MYNWLIFVGKSYHFRYVNDEIICTRPIMAFQASVVPSCPVSPVYNFFSESFIDGLTASSNWQQDTQNRQLNKIRGIVEAKLKSKLTAEFLSLNLIWLWYKHQGTVHWPAKVRNLTAFSFENPYMAHYCITLLDWYSIYGPRQANLCLRAFRHNKFQLRMPSHSEGLGNWLSVWRFLLTHCLYKRAAKVLARLRGCAGSPEPSLLA